MFKYLRNLNNVSVPSEVYTFTSPSYDGSSPEIKVGDMISLTMGEICDNFSPNDPMYLSLSSKKEGETKDINCIRITSGMLLEADIGEDTNAESLFVGALCGVFVDERSKGVGLSTTAKNVFEVMNYNPKNGKITVAVL